MSDFMMRMAARSRERSAVAMEALPRDELERRIGAEPPPLSLSHHGFDLIAEVKKRSPAVGQLSDASLAPREQADRYARGGAAAISVLTEPEEFLGSLDDLVAVTAGVTSVPAMRKDFLTTPYQIVEARAAGAGGVLLVVAILSDADLRDMLALSLDLGLFALVEIFDETELERCVPIIEDCAPAGNILLGVNCRDLRSLAIDFNRFESLAKRLPPIVPWVAESGVVKPQQAAEVAAMGYQLALVGTALMRADNPVDAAEALLRAGRDAN